jgi:chromosome segregation ATPase
VSETLFTTPGPSGSGSGAKIPILFGAVVALLGATAYQFYQVKQLRTELTETREQLLAQISRVHETSTVSTQTNKRSVEQLKQDVEQARRQAGQLAGEARAEAERHAEQLAAKLRQAQEQQARQVAAVASDVSAVKEDASATRSKVGEVSTDLAVVKTEAAATRSELEKTIAELKSTRGDLGVQSGLIATNSRELAALKSLGERNYTEFKLAKEKTARKVGDILVKLKSADPKKNRYTIEVVADDKTFEKKDRTINEPVQFILSKATLPFELVVNDIRKDMISGYLAAPKVQQSRN